MPVTFTPTILKVYSIGDRKEVIADIACTGTPTVGGDALTAAQLGLSGEMDIIMASAACVAGGATGAAVAVQHGTTGAGPASVSQVLIQFLVAAATPTAAVALAAYTGATAGFIFRVRAVGKGTAVGTPS